LKIGSNLKNVIFRCKTGTFRHYNLKHDLYAHIIFANLLIHHALQVTFHYVGYNESGRRIDSTYLQGTPAKIRMGTKALVPG